MRILVTYGSKRGGTRGLAEMVADDGHVKQWTQTIAGQLRGGVRQEATP